MTTIENIKGININTEYFDKKTPLDFFDQKRIAIVYGENGSGKSTIARAIQQYNEQSPTPTFSFRKHNETDSTIPPLSSHDIFVFDEHYINENVGFKSDGLDTIVLFGKQVSLEAQIEEIQKKLKNKNEEYDKILEGNRVYDEQRNSLSPQYWNMRIESKLREDGGWADRLGKKIRGNATKYKVTPDVIERLGTLNVVKPEAQIKNEYDNLHKIYEKTKRSGDSQLEPPIQLVVTSSETITKGKELLGKVVVRPTLTEREQELLDTLGLGIITESKAFIEDDNHLFCKTCLREITEDERKNILERIDRILNREVADFQKMLDESRLEDLSALNYDIYAVADESLVVSVSKKLKELQSAIQNYNQAIDRRKSNPFIPIEYSKECERLCRLCDEFCDLLRRLEEKRLEFNKIAADKRKVLADLECLNDQMAYYGIRSDYAELKKRRAAQEESKKALAKLLSEKSVLSDELADLNGQRANVQYAADDINTLLSYVFCTTNRLHLDVQIDPVTQKQSYKLKVYGKAVCPKNISCGERNALALCYFFLNIASGLDHTNMYVSEKFVVIDDPVSSLDIGNRVGILSFLRYKFHQMLTACATTKILIFTHDLSVFFDLQKVLDDIKKELGIVSEKKVECLYKSYRLHNKELVCFNLKVHDEYTQLMHGVYDFAVSNQSEQVEFGIGNSIRRLLEAFSTFMFKSGIEDITLRPNVLLLIPDEKMRGYFKHSMYRLVLNTCSHMRESVQSELERNFFTHLSLDEKRKIAQDVLCFMYLINREHVLSYLVGVKKVDVLDVWKHRIEKALGTHCQPS